MRSRLMEQIEILRLVPQKRVSLAIPMTDSVEKLMIYFEYFTVSVYNNIYKLSSSIKLGIKG